MHDIIFIESGILPLKEIVHKRSAAFYKKQFRRQELILSNEKPLLKIYKLCERKRTDGYKYINKLLDNPNIFGMHTLLQKFSNEFGTKAATYRLINNTLSVHKVYTSKAYLTEYERIVFTRLRLSSHNLFIEKGRWSRVPRDNRICECDEGIQDEEHILLDCPLNIHIRETFQINRGLYENNGTLMHSLEEAKLIKFIKRCMDTFE